MTEDASDDQQLVPLYGFGMGGPGPSRLADLASIEGDLRTAARMFVRVAETGYEDDPDLRRALYDSGAIAYRRGFTGGRSLLQKGTRARVPDEIIESLDEQDRLAHEAILEHVNQHIAHRVSDAEQWRVILMLNNPQHGRAIAGLTWFGARFVGPKAQDALRDAAIATKLADGLAEPIKEAHDLLLAVLNQEDLDELYAKSEPLDEPLAPDAATTETPAETIPTMTTDDVGQ